MLKVIVEQQQQLIRTLAAPTTTDDRRRRNVKCNCYQCGQPGHYGVQPPVTFPIDDHVNVLHDYKKMGPSKILKFLTCCYHHLIDMLFEFSQSRILLTLLKCLNVPHPSMFTNFCMNYYAHVPCGEKIAKNPSAY